jgi:hypothetical protein
VVQSRLATVVDHGTLAAIGAIIVGFGIAAFAFRIQRELQVAQGGQPTWIPWADRLLIGVVTVALVLILFPIALAGSRSGFWSGRLPAAACSASTIALTGYIPALLAHYRFGPRPAKKWIWFGLDSDPCRDAGEPAERVIVIVSVVLGVAAAAGSFVVTG